MRQLIALALLVPLVGCSAVSSALKPAEPLPTLPAVPPQTLAQNAADCGIAIALAGISGGVSAIGGAIARTPSCMALPGDVIARLQGDATVKVTAARRQMRLRP